MVGQPDGDVEQDFVFGFGQAFGASLAALLDAMLQDPEHHDRLQSQVIAPLARAQASARAQKQQDVAASKVEFFNEHIRDRYTFERL